MISDQNCTQFNYHFITSILISYFKQALKSDWLFCFSIPFSLAGEKVRFNLENRAIRELITLLRANQFARITIDF